MRRFLVALTLVALLGLQACSDRKGKNYNKVNDDGVDFVNEAAESGAAEIKLSELAIKNSQNKEVTDFAKAIIADHSEEAKELKDIAEKGKFKATDTLNHDHNLHLTSLAGKTGIAFDKEYLQIMVHEHEQTIKFFKENSTNASAKLQAFTAKNLPKLEAHLKEANAICTGLK
jgi:putative membrane protein